MIEGKITITSMTMWHPDLSERAGPLYRALADAIATARPAEIKGGGHMLPLEAPEPVNEALETLYAETEAAGG